MICSRTFRAAGLVFAAIGAAALSVGVLPTPAEAEGTLRVGVWAMPPAKGNPFGGRGTPSTLVWDALFDPLVRPDASGQPSGVLASSWRNVDATTWEFTLRDGVTFSNGVPLNADAVVKTFEYLLSEEGKATPVGREVGTLAAVAKVDDITVSFTTSRPNPVFVNQVALVSIVEPGQWEALGAEGFADEPVGTGPFTVTEWTGSGVELAANESSWRKPNLSAVSIVDLPERPARLQAILSGQVDVAFNLSPDSLPQIEGAGISVDVNPAPQVMSLMFINQGKESPFTDVRVRQAANLAVNREAIATALLAGHGKPASQGATPAAFGYNADLAPMAYDPEQAKALLAEAGFPDGFDMVAEVTVGAFPADSEIYQQAAADLRQVGINLELRQITFGGEGGWLQKFLGNAWEGEAFGSSWNTAPYMDSIRAYTYQTCAKRNPHFCDDSMTDLYDATWNEFDPAKRADLLGQLHAQTQDVAPALFLVEQIDVNAVAGNVQGWSYVNRFIDYTNVQVN